MKMELDQSYYDKCDKSAYLSAKARRDLMQKKKKTNGGKRGNVVACKLFRFYR